MAAHVSNKIEYQRLVKDEEDQTCSGSSNEDQTSCKRPFHRLRLVTAALVILLSAGADFFAGAIWMRNVINVNDPSYSSSTAPRIPIPYTQAEFVYSSPFSLEPPHGAGEESEPIWDGLVPSMDLLAILHISGS